MPKNNKRSIGPRFKTCKEKTQTIKKEIKIAKKKKTGITSCQINTHLVNCANFIGCFAQDELKDLTIRSLPVFIIVNFDHSASNGTHWIAIYISKTTLEIFDPLGFNTSLWPNIPHFLLDFLHKYSTNRKILISKQIQSPSSTLCGFFCIYFVLHRTNNTFKICNNLFSAQLLCNDNILINVFNKI